LCWLNPLGMPALVVEPLWEAVPHRAPIGRPGPAAAGVAPIEANDCLPNAKVCATEAMVVLRIVARISEGGVDPNECRSLSHGWGEVGRVLARADARHGAKEEVRVGMDHGGEFRPGALAMTLAPAPQPEVGADVPCLEPRRVHRRNGGGVDQAALAGTPDHHILSPAEGPPALASARRRRAACARVE